MLCLDNVVEKIRADLEGFRADRVLIVAFSDARNGLRLRRFNFVDGLSRSYRSIQPIALEA
jgi:hypothetical protein